MWLQLVSEKGPEAENEHFIVAATPRWNPPASGANECICRLVCGSVRQYAALCKKCPKSVQNCAKSVRQCAKSVQHCAAIRGSVRTLLADIPLSMAPPVPRVLGMVFQCLEERRSFNAFLETVTGLTLNTRNTGVHCGETNGKCWATPLKNGSFASYLGALCPDCAIIYMSETDVA